MKERIRRMIAIVKHKIAFWKTEKQILGRNTCRGLTHDLGKLLMYFLPLSTRYIRYYHKRNSRHHNRTCMKDYVERLVDMECARFTKRNSSLTAREFVERNFSPLTLNYKIFTHLLDEYGLK
jgi:hypothetical protein